uniref:Uncharacterized protein n=1 Tax=Rhizophora mucronata TaxID=61149 RepID=A0A2P2QCP1_RHIMU
MQVIPHTPILFQLLMKTIKKLQCYKEYWKNDSRKA